VLPFHPTYAVKTIAWAYDGALIADPLGTVYRTGTPRYQVWFNDQTAVSRQSGVTAGVDADWEFPNSNNSPTWKEETPHELYRLDTIKVVSMAASSYQLVRQYNLSYAALAASLQTDDYTGQQVLTLTNVERLDANGQILYVPNAASERPFLTTFTYHTDRGVGTNNTRPNGFNRLAMIDNGQGGTLTFTYEHAFAQGSTDSRYAPPTTDWSLYRNIYRVTQALAQDLTGTGKSALTTYSYDKPAVNHYNYAATVIYARYPTSGNGDSRTYLARQENREFRGHQQVIARHYDGATTAALLNETRHWFYQGDAGCLPTIVSTMVSETDACFVQMVANESWKGQEFQTEVWQAGGTTNPLQRTTRTFSRIALPFWGDASTAGASNNYKRVGLWRAFNPEIQTMVATYAGGSTAVTKTTKSFYTTDCTTDTSATVTASYGNPHCIQELAGATLVRKTLRWYGARNDSAGYSVDRMWQESTYDGNGYLLALTNQFYDGTSAADAAPTVGELRRVTRYANIPANSTSTVGYTLLGSDSTFLYDGYGNRTTDTTYTGASTRLYNGTTTTWGAPTGTARSSTTGYDGVFHAFPTSFSNALGQSEQAGYNYVQGTLTSVTDANNSTTSATYDGFGRMTTLTKPGDGGASPTVQAYYGDTERPFRYQVAQREQAGTGNLRYSQSFYDGLGRAIQTKQEGPGAWQNIVADTRYDGLNRAAQQAQPRYSTETSTSFWQYTAPDTNLFNPTSTSYDALSRPLDVTAPDGTTTQTRYAIGTQGMATTVDDANGHRTVYESDALGRLRWVYAYQGNNGSEGGYTSPAVTTYTYSPLDLLTSVSDAKGNVTSMGYDTLGRKTSMLDPDMGAWSYAYNPTGTLAAQTDAKGQTISFAYDALDRLTSKTYPDSTQALYRYDEAGVPNGTGRRTSISNAGDSTVWQYDARGRVTTTTHYSLWLVNPRSFQQTYDSADRVQTLTYPSGEVLTTGYDAAGRPATLASNWFGYLVSGATYTALDQPDAWAFGNGLTQDWNYSSPLQRLSTLQVSSLFTRNYGYDPVGNVQTITDPQWPQTQHFTYDHRDRLTRAWTTATLAVAPTMPAVAQAPQAPRAALTADLTADLSDMAEARGAPAQPPSGSGKALLAPLAQGGTRIKDITFEGGLLDATTGVDSISGAVNLETIAPLKDTQSATIPNNATGYLAENFTGTNDLYVSLYVNAASFPASARLVQLRNGTTTVGTLTLNTNGTLTLKNAVSAATIGSSAALSANTLYRIGIRQSSGSGTGVLEAYLASGDAAFGAPFATNSAETITGQASEMRIGATNSNAVNVTVDDIRLDSAAMPGPSGSSSPTATPTHTPLPPTATPTNTPVGPTATPTATPAPVAPPAYDETYAYDTIGNLTSKPGVGVYGYGLNGNGTGAGPHQVRTIGGNPYSYDLNGNLLSGGGRTFTWTPDNLPATVTSGGVTESYSYDADGERVRRAASDGTTIYVEGRWDERTDGWWHSRYLFNGQVIGEHDNWTGGTVTYLHGDHLGSVSLATNSSGAAVSKQDFDPWGKVRGTSAIGQTSLNYTGQRLDGTGLLYYHARYYDPVLVRFVSADTIVPGAGALTVAPSDATAAAAWATGGGGARNPQELNRYSYVNNNPLRYTDPTGHCVEIVSCTLEGAAAGTVVAPGVGTAVGAVVGFVIGAVIVVGVGAGIAYVASEVVNSGTEGEGEAPESQNNAGDYHLPGDVPDGHVVVRGGIVDLPEPGTEFSGSHGPTTEDAAAGVPHGTVRSTTAGNIRAGGGNVEVAPEPAYEGGPTNYRHVNVKEGPKGGGFSEPYQNPVPKNDRIPGRPR
jgi:RHS repeat-associated protein